MLGPRSRVRNRVKLLAPRLGQAASTASLRSLLLSRHSWIRNLFARPVSRTVRAAPHRFRPTLDVLEDRCVPSVSVVQNGNTLKIVDPDTNGADHTISVNQSALGQFVVQVDSGPIGTFNGVANIDANLGQDSDTLNFFTTGHSNHGPSGYLSGNLTVTAGDGNNNVSEDLSGIKGNVSVNEGKGNDNVEVNGVINGNLSVNQVDSSTKGGGPRGSSVEVDSLSVINGNLSVTQGDGPDDTADVFGATVGGNLSIKQGNGDSDHASVDSAMVGGNLSINQGNGAGDSINQSGGSQGGGDDNSGSQGGSGAGGGSSGSSGGTGSGG